MKKVIILGSNSFAGSCFVDYMLDKKYKVFGFSRSNEPSKLLLKYKSNKNLKNFKFTKFDINKDLNFFKNFLNKNKVDYIVDFLGQGMVAESWINPHHWYQTNIVAKVKLYDFLCQNLRFKKYIRISSPEAVGDKKGYIKENVVAHNPSTPYGISHLSIDLTLLAYFKYNKFPFVISRFSNFHGPHQQLYRVIPKTLYCIFNKKKLQLQGGGKSIRSFIYIDDFCRGIYLSMIKGKVGEIYNFSNREYVSIKWIVKTLCSLTSANFNKVVKIAKDRPTKDHSYKMDSAKAKKEFNWEAKYSIKEGMKETVKWYAKNKKQLALLKKYYVHKK